MGFAENIERERMCTFSCLMREKEENWKENKVEGVRFGKNKRSHLELKGFLGLNGNII